MTLPPCVRNNRRFNTINGRGPAPLTIPPVGQIVDRPSRAGGETLVLHYLLVETCSALPVQVGDVAPKNGQGRRAGPSSAQGLGGLRVIQYLDRPSPMAHRL